MMELRDGHGVLSPSGHVPPGLPDLADVCLYPNLQLLSPVPMPYKLMVSLPREQCSLLTVSMKFSMRKMASFPVHLSLEEATYLSLS